MMLRQIASKIFDAHIAPKALVKTDGWRGCWPLGKDWNMTKGKSNKGTGFPLLHMHVMNIKGWLRGHTSQMRLPFVTKLFGWVSFPL